MGRRLAAVTLLVGCLVAATATSVAAGAGPRQVGPPEFVQQMHRLGAEVMAQERIRIRNNAVECDLPPVIRGGRVLIPIRAVTRALGAEVHWDEDQRKITIVRGEITIVLYLEEVVFYVNGVPHELDVPGQLLANRTFVPLRFIAQALGERVKWNAVEGTVDIGDDD